MPGSWEEIIAEVGRRTVHVACLPFNATLEKLVECFSDFGAVNQVRMLKHLSDKPEHRNFRGTCLIELGTEEEAKAVLATPVEYDNCQVRIQTKTDYDAAMKKVSFRILLSSAFPVLPESFFSMLAHVVCVVHMAHQQADQERYSCRQLHLADYIPPQ